MLTILLYLWSMLGAIVGPALFYKGTLPEKGNTHKAIDKILVLYLGPILWLSVGVAITAKSLKVWLNKEDTS